jgi:hypothetical protein
MECPVRQFKFFLSFALLALALLALPAQGWTLPPTVEINYPYDGDVYVLNDSNALAAYECQSTGDALIVFCEGDVPHGSPIDTSTTGEHTFTVEARDSNDEQHSVSTTYWVAGPPSVTLNSPSDGDVFGLGWSVEPNYSCNADSRTTIATCSDTGIDTSTPGTHSFTATATDELGQSASVSINYTVAALPSVDLVTPADGAVYKQGEAVTVDFSCSADQLATSIWSCIGSVGDGSQLDTSTLGDHSLTVTATDMLSQAKVVTHDYTVAAKPTVNITTPPNGAIYTIDQAVTADYSCTADPATTISSCVGTVADGALVDTSSAGAKIFTVTATDSLGQVRTVIRNYTVAAPAPPAAQPQPPAEVVLATRLEGRPKLARSGESVTVRQVCGQPRCVVTLTITIGKKKYRVRSKPLAKSTSTKPTAVKIKLPSKVTRQVKQAKKQRRKLRIKAKISGRA